MAEGLMFVLSQPRPGDEAEFHSWYDDEHAPARLTVPGIRTAERYAGTDDARPDWLALYELDLDALATPEYRALNTDRSERETKVMGRLETLDRRVYELMGEYGTGSGPDRLLMVRAFTVPRPAVPDLDAWYAEEHIAALQAVPGWGRIRRYRLLEGAGAEYLALHEISGTEIFDTEEYRAAVTTPWRDRVVASAVVAERRLFTHHRSFA